MKRLAEIEAAYLRIDAHIDELRLSASADRFASIETAQSLNDQAYFVLCWGQLETEINERCAELIRARQSSADWQIRRGWDRYDANNLKRSRLAFEDRVSMVLDRHLSKPNRHELVLRFYEIRNQIAHGRLLSRRLDVVEAIAEFRHISGEINRHAA